MGRTFTDPAVGVSVTTEWVTSTQAGVTVQLADTGGPVPDEAVVAVATVRPSYIIGQMVTMTATVRTSAGSPIAKASVTFTVTKANGTVVSAAASTAPTAPRSTSSV